MDFFFFNISYFLVLQDALETFNIFFPYLWNSYISW